MAGLMQKLSEFTITKLFKKADQGSCPAHMLQMQLQSIFWVYSLRLFHQRQSSFQSSNHSIRSSLGSVIAQPISSPPLAVLLISYGFCLKSSQDI